MGVGKVSRQGGTNWKLGGMISRRGSTTLGLSGRGTWGRLLGKALAKASAFLLACSSLKATELGLGEERQGSA